MDDALGTHLRPSLAAAAMAARTPTRRATTAAAATHGAAVTVTVRAVAVGDRASDKGGTGPRRRPWATAIATATAAAATSTTLHRSPPWLNRRRRPRWRGERADGAAKTVPAPALKAGRRWRHYPFP